MISGLRWDFASNPEQASQWTKYLDLHDLFSIDPQKQIRIEDAIPGSPLIALYIQDNPHTEGHNGQLFWYNLDTRGRGEIDRRRALPITVGEGHLPGIREVCPTCSKCD